MGNSISWTMDSTIECCKFGTRWLLLGAEFLSGDPVDSTVSKPVRTYVACWFVSLPTNYTRPTPNQIPTDRSAMRVQLVATVLAGMALGATAFLQTPGTCVSAVSASCVMHGRGGAGHPHIYALFRWGSG